jgi:hypothetical protein
MTIVATVLDTLKILAIAIFAVLAVAVAVVFTLVVALAPPGQVFFGAMLARVGWAAGGLIVEYIKEWTK